MFFNSKHKKANYGRIGTADFLVTHGVFIGEFLLFAFCTLALWFFIQNSVRQEIPYHSPYDQHTRQAIAWREGKIHLETMPKYLELAVYRGTIYNSFPPTPTLLELPFTFIYGKNTPNTTTLLVFTWLSLLFSFLILFKLTDNRVLSYFMAVAFYWGSNILYLSLRGAVWNQGQLFGVFFCTSAFLVLFHATKFSHLTFGVFLLGLSVGCRPFYSFVIFYYLYLSYERFKSPRVLIYIGAGLLIPGTLLAWYNYVRFDSIIEFGHTFLFPPPRDALGGLFGFQYLGRNLLHALWFFPELRGGVLNFHGRGVAVWIVSPVILFGLAYFLNRSVPRLEKTVAGSVVGIIWLMLLLHSSNGWHQFGYRYAVDLVPLLIVFFAKSFRRLHWSFVAVGLYSITINIYGAYWYYTLRQTLNLPTAY